MVFQPLTYQVCIWLQNFTIQLIFATIHGPHCTFWYYLQISLYYFQLIFIFIYNTFNKKKFQFQQNKWIPNRLQIYQIYNIQNLHFSITKHMEEHCRKSTRLVLATNDSLPSNLVSIQEQLVQLFARSIVDKR